MRVGNNEKTLLAIMQKYPNYPDRSLQLMFHIVTGKKLKIKRTIRSLREKDLLTKDGTVLTDKLNVNLPEIPIITQGIIDMSIDANLRFGKPSKQLLYVLYKAERASISFLAKVLNMSNRNIIPILQRLEEKNLVYRYTSLFHYQDSMGRRYRPKYYGTTELGKDLMEVLVKENSENYKQIDEIIQNVQKSITKMKDEFQGSLKMM